MSDTRKLALLLTAAVLFVLAFTSVFIVRENQQVLVLRFGNPQAQVSEPGLHFKLAFVDQLKLYEKRILNVDPPAEQVTLGDQKRLVVDTFARYRISHMLTFFQALGTEEMAEQRINNIINSATRQNLGRVTLDDMLSNKRIALMKNILKDVNAQTARLGVQVVDVRIVRADLPEQVTQSTFARMKSERAREAQEARSEGEQLATEIKSQAEKERTIILAEAEKDAQIIRGKGDNEAITIYSQAFGQDPQFYAFYRSLEAYKASLSNPDTTLVLSPDSEFFRYFKDKLATP